jgi:polysaccharide export outer membrane protein
VGGALLVATLLTIASACTSPFPSEDIAVVPEVVESTARFRKLYILSPGDQIEIVVRRNEDVSRAVVVRPDGYISLPLLDDVKAAGFTIPELDERLTNLLSDRLLDPEVTVVATQVREPKTYVYGEVSTARPIALRDASTVAQAISEAGGFLPSAAKDSVVVIRLNNKGRLMAIKVDLEISGQPAPIMAAHNILLQADDMIFVPKTGIAQFNTWVDEYIKQPTGSFTEILSSYANYKIVTVLDD